MRQGRRPGPQRRPVLVLVRCCLALLLLVGAAAGCDEAGPPAAEQGARHVLAELREDTGAPGALVVVERDGRRSAAASGLATLAGEPVRVTQTFRVGSITKPVVAALVLEAVRRGELSLDDAVARHVPGVVQDGDRITVRMLLDHTSGIFDEGNEGNVFSDVERLPEPGLRERARRLLLAHEEGRDVVAPARVIVALAETHRHYFAPGDGHHYSNVNYQVAGMVLERVTGRPLAELLADRVARPLGLTSTSLAPADRGVPQVHGYRPGAGGNLVDVTEDLATFGNGGHGGVVSTADELLEVLTAVTDGTLLGPRLTAEMRATAPQSQGSYGLGLATYDLRCGAFHGHGGAVNGTTSLALVDAATSRGLVLAVNLQRDGVDLLPWAERLLCG